MQAHDGVDQSRGVGAVVEDGEHGGAGLLVRAQGRQGPGAALRIEAGGDLVEQQQRSRCGQGYRNSILRA